MNQHSRLFDHSQSALWYTNFSYCALPRSSMVRTIAITDLSAQSRVSIATSSRQSSQKGLPVEAIVFKRLQTCFWNAFWWESPSLWCFRQVGLSLECKVHSNYWRRRTISGPTTIHLRNAVGLCKTNSASSLHQRVVQLLSLVYWNCGKPPLFLVNNPVFRKLFQKLLTYIHPRMDIWVRFKLFAI